MKLTKEQLNIIGESYLDELPFYYGDVDQEKLWNNLPIDIQTEGLKHGANDTVVREIVSSHLLETQLGITIEEWYDKDNEDNYNNELAQALFKLKDPIWIEIDYTKL